MNITRHNYEEYFILYMDNELGSEDRHQVKLFLQENPDLMEELNWLLQSRLVPDASLVFDHKEQLMKTSSAGSINTTNYEEWLLLYTDNELTSEQRITVEKFVAGHPATQEELALLQKTKLQPEQDIIFHNKELLYRKEEKVRVMAISWRKIAVAASLLIAISTTGLIVFNKKDSSLTELASGEKTGLKSMPENSADKLTVITTDTNTIVVDNSSQTTNETAALNNPAGVITNKKITPKQKNSSPSDLLKKEVAPVVAENNSGKKRTNDLPQPTYNPNVNSNTREDNPIAQTDLPVKKSLTNLNENIEALVVTPGNSQSLNNVVTAASVESIDPTDAEQPGKKNKLRGIFRKVTRTFEKTTNIKATDDEDRLLLGGLAIKL